MNSGILLVGIFTAWVVFVIVVLILARRRGVRKTEALRGKNEALFRSMFPELQPYFHPERLVEFVVARLDRSWSLKAPWTNTSGFPIAATAELKADGERERVRLLDAAGKLLQEFTFEKHAEGGVIRVGKGKLTVDTRRPAQPRVRYWHPDREFKWTRAGWVFMTPVADEPFETSSSSSSLTGSSSHSTRTTAAAAGIVGLGGTFDGGGASAGWDESSKGSHSESGGGDLSSAAAVASSDQSSSDSTSDSGSTAY